MSIDILIVILITSITIIQFDLRSKKGKIGFAIGIFALIVQSIAVYKSHEEKEIQNTQISEIKASVEAPIDWKKSNFKLEFVDENISDIFLNNLAIAFKIYPLNEKILSSNKINISNIIKTANANNLTGYKELTTEQALNLFNMFSENEKINNDIEEKAGIGHLYLISNKIDMDDKKIVNLKSEYSGLEALKNFNTLKKLNNTILLAYIPVTDFHKDGSINVINKLMIKLETSHGERRIFFNVKPFQGQNLKFVDVVGIYIPNNYF